jgi:hypothetical protein
MHRHPLVVRHIPSVCAANPVAQCIASRDLMNNAPNQLKYNLGDFLRRIAVTKTTPMMALMLAVVNCAAQPAPLGDRGISGWLSSDRVFINDAVHHSGERSACIRLSGVSPRLGPDLEQRFKADHYRGQMVQFSFYVLAEQFFAGFMSVDVRVDGPNGPVGGCSFHPVEVARKWELEPWPDPKPHYGRCIIPKDAVGVTLRVTVNHGATDPRLLCLDDFAVETVNAADVTSGAQPASDEIRRQIQAEYAHANPMFTNGDFEAPKKP